MHVSVPLSTVFGTPTAPRNSLPSLHFAWALLILWSLKPGQRLARLLAVLFVIATVLATLGSGEHYLVDLIVAVPFATSVQRGCQRQWKMMALYGAITLLWIAYLRFGMPYFEPSRAAAWLAGGITVSLPALLRLTAFGTGQRMIRHQKFATAGSHHIEFQRGR